MVTKGFFMEVLLTQKRKMSKDIDKMVYKKYVSKTLSDAQLKCLQPF